MLIIREHFLFNFKMIKQLQRNARVLGGDKIRLTEYSHGAWAEILQIPYRRTDNIKFSAHYYKYASLYGP